jgi:hypothetical protein
MRNYVRKTERVKAPSDVIDRAVAMVLDDGKSCSSVAILFDIPRMTENHVLVWLFFLTFQEEVLLDMLKRRRSQV